MWIMLNNAFVSIVKKDCPRGHLLVRARRLNDIRRAFGVKATRTTNADYLYRAVIPLADVQHAISAALADINYPNFKASVREDDLSHAYTRVWVAMADIQNPQPYSARKRR